MATTESAYDVIGSIADASSLRAAPQAEGEAPSPALDYPMPYAERLARAREETGLACGVVWGEAEIGGSRAVLVANDWRFFGASIGTAEAAALASAFDAAVQAGLPVVWLARGGGSRMQECAHSLAALSRALAARSALAAAGVPLISVAMDPLFGGSNLLATQGDVVLAVAGARVGYAGVRVVEMMEPKPLPEGFQTAEWACRNGHADAVVAREQVRDVLADLLRLLAPDQPTAAEEPVREVEFVRRPPWECVQMSRSPGRPSTRELLAQMAEPVFELRGDRVCGDDPAVVGALARIAGRRFVVIGHAGVHAEWDRILHNLNTPHPSGHRKALRLVRLAERLGLPILTVIDTAGACPDAVAEAEGQGHALGQLITAMLEARVPTVALITGEGNAAAALALACADQVMMTDASWYSIIAPEGAAAILWRDVEKKHEAATQLHLTPAELLEAGLIDTVIPHHQEPAELARTLRSAAAASLFRARDRSPGRARRSRELRP
jgi:acetyl-CoA carboxylase carboxyl transferase alpha subunit